MKRYQRTTPPHLRRHPPDQGVDLRNILPRIQQTFLDVGTTVGKYTIIEEIDHGGMAVVYRALQLDLDREVALKVMPAHICISKSLLERFLSEAHAVARLNHPSIVTIYEVTCENSIYFIAMDYIPGKNLYYYLNECKPKLVEVVDIVLSLTDALAYAHKCRIVHRDLKLNNVIMRDNRTPILIDFGLAKALEEGASEITRTGEVVGSPAYMAPERIVGGASDHRSDICSLGIMLYEMLTFKNPYLDQRSIHQTTLNVIEANPISPRKLVPWLPPEIEAITLKAMEADPQKRYQTMEEMREDLLRFKKGEPVQAQPPTLTSRARHFGRKYWPHITIGVLVLLFSLLALASHVIQTQKEKSHWQLVHVERFNKRPPDGEWESGAHHAPVDTIDWVVEQGELRPLRSSLRWYTLQHPFTRDIRVTFDISSDSLDFHHAGAFLYGPNPDSGYAFHLHRPGPVPHGVTLPANPVMFSDYDPLTFQSAHTYRVEIERDDGVIRFRLNGQLIAQRHDLTPPLGPRHRTIGFFSTSKNCSFDNLRVLQRAVPLSPSPTLIADRLWERGDFEAALEEYEALRMDFTRYEFARHVLTRIPDCLIRLGRFEAAHERLSQIPEGTSRLEGVRRQTRFFRAISAWHLGRYEEADTIYRHLIAGGFDNPAAQSSEAILSARISSRIASGALDDAVGLLTELTAASAVPSRVMGALHLEVADRFRLRGDMDRAENTSLSIIRLHARDAFIHSKAQVALARVLLDKRKKGDAIDILNQCIATHLFTEGVWEAWMLLAAIYESERNYRDAMTIYRKVYRECPRGTHIPWDARLKMGELAKKTTIDESRETIFSEVILAPHPFARSRLKARLFSGEITEQQVTSHWVRLYPASRAYLHLIARKALMNGEPAVARVYLQEYRQHLHHSTWEHARIQRLLNEISGY